MNDVEFTVRLFSELWRKIGLSATIKLHIIGCHLMTNLQRFRGLGGYDEEFIKRAHQEGCKMEKRSANIKDANIKAFIKPRFKSALLNIRGIG